MKVGIIGCGKITEVRHAPEYAENPLVRMAIQNFSINPVISMVSGLAGWQITCIRPPIGRLF